MRGKKPGFLGKTTVGQYLVVVMFSFDSPRGLADPDLFESTGGAAESFCEDGPFLRESLGCSISNLRFEKDGTISAFEMGAFDDVEGKWLETTMELSLRQKSSPSRSWEINLERSTPPSSNEEEWIAREGSVFDYLEHALDFALSYDSELRFANAEFTYVQPKARIDRSVGEGFNFETHSGAFELAQVEVKSALGDCATVRYGRSTAGTPFPQVLTETECEEPTRFRDARVLEVRQRAVC